MKRCVVLFGVDPLTAAMATGALRQKGIEVVIPPTQEYTKPIGTFAGEKIPVSVPPYQGSFPEPMVLLCHLERELDEVLSTLESVRLGRSVLRAILTEYNCCWSAVMLLRELRRERNSFLKKRV